MKNIVYNVKFYCRKYIKIEENSENESLMILIVP